MTEPLPDSEEKALEGSSTPPEDDLDAQKTKTRPSVARNLNHIETAYRHSFHLGLGAAASKYVGAEPIHAADIGVGRGRTLALLCQLAAAAGDHIRIAALGSFESEPEVSPKDYELNAHNPAFWPRLHPESTVREVEAFLEPLQGGANVEIIPGNLIGNIESLPDRRYFFVHVSSILYEVHRTALEHFYPRMIEGGVILIDHYHDKQFPSSKAAVDEFLEDKEGVMLMLQTALGATVIRKALIVRSGS